MWWQVLLDRTHNNWNLSFFFVALWLGWTLLFFAIGWQLSKRNVAALMEPLIGGAGSVQDGGALAGAMGDEDGGTKPSRVSSLLLCSWWLASPEL
jgi:hypothetical protein